MMPVFDDQGRFEIDLEEDLHGTYFFNSRDLNMIRHIGRLFACGVDSLKIEGRAKSIYYVAIVVRAYRKVIDAVFDHQQGKISKGQLQKEVDAQENELNKIANRGYSTGFYLGREPVQLLNRSANDPGWIFVGVVGESIAASPRTRKLLVHNVLKQGDEVEVITARGNYIAKVISIKESGKLVRSAHGGQGKSFAVEFSNEINGFFLLRKRAN